MAGRNIRSRLSSDQIAKIVAVSDEFAEDGSVYEPDSDKSDSETEGDISSGEDFSSSDDDTDEDEGDDVNHSSNLVSPAVLAPSAMWHDVTGSYRKHFFFTASDAGLQDVPIDDNPLNFFELFVTSEVINLIVTSTNRVAILKKDKTDKNPWHDVDEAEIKEFLALIMYFGMVQYPTLKQYWSRDPKYFNNFVRSAMTRNRFEEILRFIHFSDEEEFRNDRLKKIKQLVVLLNKNFQKHRIPGENITIDESVIPFRGRLMFRQYLPGKGHKCGIKIYKACDPDGYTYMSIVYSGKKEQELRSKKKAKGEKSRKRKAKGGKFPKKKANCEESSEEKESDQGSPYEEEKDEKFPQKVECHSNHVVMELLHNYLDEGRTLVAGNFYNNLDIASQLLKRKTHLVGTLRKNTKDTPKTVMHAKLKKGGVVAQENEEGVVVGNWRDKRYVRFITTKHTIEMKRSGKKTRHDEELWKPESIIYYNKSKQGVDISDQMAAYYSPLRKTIRWFHKVAFTLLLGTAVVNAWILHQMINKYNKKMAIAEFREFIIDNWMAKDGNESAGFKHVLQKTDVADKKHSGRAVRRRCVGCYKKIKTIEGVKMAVKKAKQVTTRCITCAKKPHLCLPCFTAHSNLF